MIAKVLVVMGSDSDWSVMQSCVEQLQKFDIEAEVRVCSAHRTPEVAHHLSQSAADEGYCAIIAAAGHAAHLAGVMAASTTLPVIGVPIESTPSRARRCVTTAVIGLVIDAMRKSASGAISAAPTCSAPFARTRYT